MSKITIDDIKAQFASVTSINLRFKQVMDEFNTKVLYRDEDIDNRMNTDLDMGGEDLINVKNIYLKEIFKDGEPVIIPDLTWGNILGDIEDQADLYAILTSLDMRITENSDLIAIIDIGSINARLALLETEDQILHGRVDSLTVLLSQVNAKATANAAKITTLEQTRLSAIAAANHTPISLLIDKITDPLNPAIGLTAEVGTSEPFSLVKLDATGRIPNDQIPFGGAFTSRGVFTPQIDANPADNPSIRFPAETYGNGDFYTISDPVGQVDGHVLVIDEDTQVPVTIRLKAGDALVYSFGNSGNADGWYGILGQGAGSVSAENVTYDPTGDLIIDPASINVDVALNDLDKRGFRKDGSLAMTGNLWISGGSLRLESAVGDPGNDIFLINNGTGAARSLEFRNFEAGAAIASIENDGNIVVAPAAPAAINHLTRKDYVDDGDAAVQVGVDQNASGIAALVGSLANKNYIINPTFIINQRRFAGGLSTRSNFYTVDRWKGADAASNITFAGSVATIVAGSLTQIVEDFGYVGDVTVSWIGTATVDGGNTSPYTYAKVGGNDTLTFSVGTLSEVKLEIGASATPFEYPDVGTELIKCQRFYTTSYMDDDAIGAPVVNTRAFQQFFGAAATGVQGIPQYFPVKMRVRPVATLYDLAGNISKFSGVDGNGTTVDNQSPNAIYTTETSVLCRAFATTFHGMTWLYEADAEL